MSIDLTNVMNKRRLSVFISCLLLCLLSGCSTIEFVQHEQAGDRDSINRWHHVTLNGMVEISKPLNVQSICGKKAWTTITTEYTFYNSLPALIIPTTPLFSLYSAWTNKVKCYEPS